MSVVECFVHIEDVASERQHLEVVLKTTHENILTTGDVQVLPSENSPSLSYSWQHNGQRHLILPNPGCLLRYYKNLDRFILEDYAAYIFDSYDDEYLTIVTEYLQDEFGLFTSEYDEVNAIASFVQTMEYAEDDPEDTTFEYPRYPVEMLGDRQGDCEDKAILLATLLDVRDYNVSLLRLPDHMAVGVHLEKKIETLSYFIDEYYYLESTRTHWSLGMVPPEYKDSTNITVYPVSDRPLLFHSWKNATRYTNRGGTDFVKIHCLIQNIGRGDARNVEVRGGFFTEDHVLYNQVTTVISVLPAGHKALSSLKVTVPQGLSTLLKTQLYWNNKRVDEKESVSWFSSKEFPEIS